MLILISDAFDKSLPEKLSRFGEVTEDKERLSEADVVLIRSKTKADKAYLDSAKNLKLIIRGGVGMDNIDIPYAKEKQIVATNTPHSSAIAVAELAFSLMLSVPNHIVFYDTTTKAGEWQKKTKRTELYGKTLALMGMGNIAKEVAKRARAFGMNVVSYDKYVKESDLAEMKESAADAVRYADYISIHLPLTDETKEMFSKNLFDKMEKAPVIINTGRGKCVSDEDMAAALKEGKVSWYCADVYSAEPLDMASPLLSCENITLTPHVGANSNENLLRIGEEVIQTIDKYVSLGVLK
ncbi:MAG TPA: hydroxyacid dehydrogenase [Candidatus Ornithospirochaeta avicola]|uniref:Hydroxyacid dehydrogenase n=1 Tax=Candidatus Ornithospirochaeta avicola TaxID=2840896 RepID=A0A9D1TMV5_9SPIO|nr:hydroxyacid dehydrogenase [Candidatus Ornithospirochaeta avicola]